MPSVPRQGVSAHADHAQAGWLGGDMGIEHRGRGGAKWGPVNAEE